MDLRLWSLVFRNRGEQLWDQIGISNLLVDMRVYVPKLTKTRSVLLLWTTHDNIFQTFSLENAPLFRKLQSLDLCPWYHQETC